MMARNETENAELKATESIAILDPEETISDDQLLLDYAVHVEIESEDALPNHLDGGEEIEIDECDFLDLPDEILENIIRYAGYEATVRTTSERGVSTLRNLALSCHRMHDTIVRFPQVLWADWYVARFGWGGLENDDFCVMVKPPTEGWQTTTKRLLMEPLFGTVAQQDGIPCDEEQAPESSQKGSRKPRREPNYNAPWMFQFRERHEIDMDETRKVAQEMARLEARRVDEIRRHNALHRRAGRCLYAFIFLTFIPYHYIMLFHILTMLSLQVLVFITIPLKLDGVLTGTWTESAFLPIWLLTGWIFIMSMSIYWRRVKDPSGFGMALFSTCGIVWSQSTYVIFPLFVALRLDAVIDWLWSLIFIPTYTLGLSLCGLGCLSLCIMGARVRGSISMDSSDFGTVIQVWATEYPLVVFFLGCLFSLSLTVFNIILPLFLDGFIDPSTSLFVIFIPLWICGVSILIPSIAYERRGIIAWFLLVLPTTLLFPLLTALKVEGFTDASWLAVFFPLIFVVMLPLLLFIGVLMKERIRTQLFEAWDGIDDEEL